LQGNLKAPRLKGVIDETILQDALNAAAAGDGDGDVDENGFSSVEEYTCNAEAELPSLEEVHPELRIV
jgi:hypothetical protein